MFWFSSLLLVFPLSSGLFPYPWLRHHTLLVNLAWARVLDTDSLDVLSAVSSPAASELSCAHLQQAPKEICKILLEYPDVPSFDDFSASTPKHEVFQNLSTVPGPPVFAKAPVWILGSWPPLRQSFSRWIKQVLSMFFFFVVQPSPHVVWTWWYLETLWWFPTPPPFLTDILYPPLQISPQG